MEHETSNFMEHAVDSYYVLISPSIVVASFLGKWLFFTVQFCLSFPGTPILAPSFNLNLLLQTFTGIRAIQGSVTQLKSIRFWGWLCAYFLHFSRPFNQREIFSPMGLEQSHSVQAPVVVRSFLAPLTSLHWPSDLHCKWYPSPAAKIAYSPGNRRGD